MDDYGVDLDEIGKVIERADVLVVRFQVVQRRILVDFRTSAEAGPLVRAVAPAASAEERFRSLKALRPSLPLPERIMSFLWPRSVGAMADAGVDELDTAFGELLAEEHATLVAAIRGGEGFQTLWEREPS